MPAAKHDIIIDQGSDFAMQMVVKEDGAVKDLTGYLARAQLRANRSDLEPAAEFTCEIDVEHRILMYLSNVVSQDMAPKNYYYDLEIYTESWPSNEDPIVIRLVEGKALLTPEVTKDNLSA